MQNYFPRAPLPDLLQKPYSVDLSMKYEDAEGSQIEASSSISIPIKQDARFEFSDFEISPESVRLLIIIIVWIRFFFRLFFDGGIDIKFL